jgi:tetratricopeptide (TPR) repeat protein
VAAGRKKTRKELLKEPDEFITFSSRIFSWAARYKNEITYAVLGVLVLAAAFSGWAYYSNRREAAAASLLAQALAKLERLSAEKPKGQAVREVSDDFRRIYTDYSSCTNGNIARLLDADLCYEIGDYSKAADLYKASLPQFADQPLIHFQILKSLGYTYEALKDAAAAVTYFEQAQAAGEPSLQDDVLFHLGELYARLGQKEKSADAFQRIIREHPDSIYADLVRQKVNG